MSTRPSLTISVLTKNESHQIERCLLSAAFANEVVVIDSGSTDATVERAKALGAAVHRYPHWQGFAVQRNYQLQHARSDWLMLLDADEEISPALREEILQTIERNDDTLYGFPALEVAYGAELKHMRHRTLGNRLFKRNLLRGFEGIVHEQPVLARSARKAVLKQGLKHYSRTSVHGSLRKLTQYAMLGAAKRKDSPKRAGVLRGLGSGLVSFVSNYIFRFGFTGGGAGFLFCLFIALEGFFRYSALHYDRSHLREDVQR